MTENFILSEKLKILEAYYIDLVRHARIVNANYSQLQRIHQTCKLQQQYTESCNTLLEQRCDKYDLLKIDHISLKQKQTMNVYLNIGFGVITAGIIMYYNYQRS